MCACVGVRERENPGAVPISLLFFYFRRSSFGGVTKAWQREGDGMGGPREILDIVDPRHQDV